MRRRRFLTVATTVGTVGLGSLVGYREVERRDERIAELETRVAELNREVGEARGRERSRLEATLRNYYEQGYEAYEQGEHHRQKAADNYEVERYEESVPHYRRAAEGYAVAEEFFREAVFLARDEGYEEAAGVAGDASSHATHTEFVADLYARAAVHRAHGEDAKAEADIEDAEGHRERATEGKVVPVESFLEAVRAHDGD